jgi:hypothetical protein
MSTLSPSRRAVTATAAAALLLLAAAPQALAASGSLSGSISPNKGPVGTPLRLTTGFTLDPDPGKEAGTLTQVELFFPPNARTNGARFPSCSPETINARRSFSGCPKGSKIGGGSFRADVPAADQFDVPGVITLFNGAGGKTITVHILSQNPVDIYEAFSARLVRTKGRFGYHFIAPIPPSLQEINDGWFAEVRRLTATIGATWRKTPYIQTTTTCPKSLSVPVAGTMTFLRDNDPLQLSSTIACRR